MKDKIEIRGDLLAARADAIVNAGNESLLMSSPGGLSGFIHEDIGKSNYHNLVNKQHNGKKKIETGEAILLDLEQAADIKNDSKLKQNGVKAIIHAVGPTGTNTNKENLLENAYKNSFEEAKKKGYKTIAIPALSIGIFGYPQEEAIPIIAKMVKKYESEFDKIIFAHPKKETQKLFGEAYNTITKNIEKGQEEDKGTIIDQTVAELKNKFTKNNTKIEEEKEEKKKKEPKIYITDLLQDINELTKKYKLTQEGCVKLSLSMEETKNVSSKLDKVIKNSQSIEPKINSEAGITSYEFALPNGKTISMQEDKDPKKPLIIDKKSIEESQLYGIIEIPRIDKDGKLDPNNVDRLVFEKGKLKALITPDLEDSKSRIPDWVATKAKVDLTKATPGPHTEKEQQRQQSTDTTNRSLVEKLF